jgi:hypothetical protein
MSYDEVRRQRIVDFVEEAQAFSCFSFAWSKHKFIINSLKGVGAEYILPDIHFASARDSFRDPRDGGPEAIAAFLAHHEHNAFCSLLGMAGPKTVETDADIRGFDDD